MRQRFDRRMGTGESDHSSVPILLSINLIAPPPVRLVELEVAVAADPRDETAIVLRLRRGVVEDDDEAAIGHVDAVVSAAGVASGRVTQLRPSSVPPIPIHEACGKC
jgi:hypothetical protein